MTEAIRGTYADFKLVKTRQVAQFIIEVSIEDVGELIDLFGMPNYAEGQWVAIAPLKSEAVSELTPAKAVYKGKTPEEQAVSRAAILCTDELFQDWMCQRGAALIGQASFRGQSREEVTAALLRAELKIESRSEIATNEDVQNMFLKIEGQYRDFMRYGDGP